MEVGGEILRKYCCGKNPVKHHHCVRDTQSQINKEDIYILLME